MKRSWLIDALRVSSLAAAALLLFSFLNDVLDLATHFYFIPPELTGTLWNIVGLLPSPASLVGLITHFTSDPFLAPHHRPLVFFMVQSVVAILCLAQANGLRRRQNWAQHATLLLCAVDFLVQALDFAPALRTQWTAFSGPELRAALPQLFLADARPFLKLCLDTGCAAVLLIIGEYGEAAVSSQLPLATTPHSPPPRPPTPLAHSAPVDPFLSARAPARTPLLHSNRIVFLSACGCLVMLLLLILLKPFDSVDSLVPAIYQRLLPAYLFASLQYGIVAWHTRRTPERFALGLACACSVWVCAVGLWAGPVLLIGMLTPAGQSQAAAFSGLMPSVFLVFVFIAGNFVLLAGTLRTTWLAREESNQSPVWWAAGFALPFVLLIVVRGMLH